MKNVNKRIKKKNITKKYRWKMKRNKKVSKNVIKVYFKLEQLKI